MKEKVFRRKREEKSVPKCSKGLQIISGSLFLDLKLIHKSEKENNKEENKCKNMEKTSVFFWF